MVIFPGLNSSHKCYCHQLPPYKNKVKWSSSSNINKFLKDLMCWLLLVIWFECKISRTISNPRLEITCFNPVELTPHRQRGEDLDTPQPRVSDVSDGNAAVTCSDCWLLLWWCCPSCQPPATSGAATDNTSDTRVWGPCQCLHPGDMRDWYSLH